MDDYVKRTDPANLDIATRERMAQERHGCSWNELSDFHRDRLAYVHDLQLAEAAKSAADPVIEKFGIKKSQWVTLTDTIARNLADVMAKTLPSIVDGFVRKALP